MKFVFITGVTKFSKVSIFSDLNQLNDISLTEDYVAIGEITQSKLEAKSLPEVEALVQIEEKKYAVCYRAVHHAKSRHEFLE